MLTYRALPAFLLSAFMSTAALSQATLHVPPPPADPLELATVAHDVPNTPQARSAVIALVERARQNAELNTPFSMHVSFTTGGDALHTGSGEMDETWISQRGSRWSVRLGDFSMTRIIVQGATYDDKPVAMIPLRVQMLRDALYWPVWFQPQMTKLRTASADWQGSKVTCVLAAFEGMQATEIIGRRWVEREYCVEPKSGRLEILSDAPGIYVVYDYAGAFEFHGHAVPRQISIVEAGKKVLEAHIDSLADAGNVPPDLLQPTEQMVAHGPVLSGAMRFPQVVKVAPGAAALQPVIVHAVLGEDGKVLDAELLDNSGAALCQSALDLVKQSTYARAGRNLQREAFINVKFVSQ